MHQRFCAGAGVVAAVCLSIAAGIPACAQSLSGWSEVRPLPKAATMTIRASGTFDVKIVPLAADDKAADPTLGRMSIDKQFHGDLDGSSKGQMLTAGTDVKESGVYVAIEKVTGTLQGRSGSFILHHTGVMTRGAPQLTITVVPDSGTGQLAGLAGRMSIEIVDGKHRYDFEYTLADAR